MRLYRILTQNVNYAAVIALCSAAFPDGYTVLTGTGYWCGKSEHSLIIEICSVQYTLTDIEALVYDIKKLNKQEAVLVQVLECEGKLI